MRLYSPDVEMHRRFLSNYPDHRSIDEASLADFLTAICMYEEMLLESSSAWNDKELRSEGYRSAGRIDGSSAGWVDQLKRLLPRSVSLLIKNVSFGRSAINEQESCAKAYDVLCSPLKKDILLDSGEKIPNVYFAKDYIYREQFQALNEANDLKLSDEELAQAMFLHRGIFLQSHAHENGCVYLPYQYRGKLLSKLPPMIWARAPHDGICQARLPLAQGSRLNETDYVNALNEFYYSLLQSVTWTTYSADVPFVGASILAAARGNPRDAIDIALDYREKGFLRKAMFELDLAIQDLDRPRFESLLAEYRSQLAAAARYFGAEVQSAQHRAFYELAVCWMPKGINSVVKAAVEMLPEYIRHWAYKASSTLITKTPLQMLFLEHVSAIRSVRQSGV